MSDKNEEKIVCNPQRRDLIKKIAVVSPIAIPCVLQGGLVFAEDNDKVTPEKMTPQLGDNFTWHMKKKRGNVINIDDLRVGARPKMTLPYDAEKGIVRDGLNFNQILLQRFDEKDLAEETCKHADQGVVAYSAICTHNGCPVSGWSGERKIYMCPCHQTVYDPRNSAKVVSGPAPRSLPSLPVKVAEDGTIEIAGDFSGRVGFGKKR